MLYDHSLPRWEWSKFVCYLNTEFEHSHIQISLRLKGFEDPAELFETFLEDRNNQFCLPSTCCRYKRRNTTSFTRKGQFEYDNSTSLFFKKPSLYRMKVKIGEFTHKLFVLRVAISLAVSPSVH